MDDKARVDEIPASPRAFLTADEILASDDLEVREVPMPEWKTRDGKPGVVRLRALTAEEATQFAEGLQSKDKEIKEGAALQILLMAAIDGEGKPLFKDAEQVAKLKKKSIKAMLRVQKTAMILSGFIAEETPEVAKND